MTTRRPSAYTSLPFELDTERLSLRLRTRDDAAWNLELKGEHEGGTTLTLAEEQARLVEQEQASRVSGVGFLTITRKAEGDPIGYCGLFIGRGTIDEPEIAYELLRRFHGHGYATEAASVVLDAAFSTGRRRIRATVRAWNAPSFRVLDKLGFERERVVTDEKGELVYLFRDR